MNPYRPRPWLCRLGLHMWWPEYLRHDGMVDRCLRERCGARTVRAL